MPNLILHFSGGGWELLVANTSKAIGLKLGAQGAENASVELLAEAMKEGASQIVEDAEYIFENHTEIDLDFVDNLFEAADTLLLDGAEVFSAAEGATLLEDLEAAGEALAALV